MTTAKTNTDRARHALEVGRLQARLDAEERTVEEAELQAQSVREELFRLTGCDCASLRVPCTGHDETPRRLP